MSDKPVQIVALQAERFKKLTAVTLNPTATGLTVVGGKNRQGKTSVLNAIMFGLGGDKHKPTDVQKRGTKGSAAIRLELSNGLVVERKGMNSSLYVTDADGMKGSQGLLNKFVEQLALDLPRFMRSTSKEKAHVLLKIVGVGDRLDKLDAQEKEIYAERRDADRDYKRLETELNGMPKDPDAPKDLVSIQTLTNDIAAGELAHREYDAKRHEGERITTSITGMKDRIEEINSQLAEAKEQLEVLIGQHKANEEAVAAFEVPNLVPIREQLAGAEEINERVRANEARRKKERVVSVAKAGVDELNEHLTNTRADRDGILKEANMPLEGLSVVDGELVYNESVWDGMSTADQMMVAASIVQKINPQCGFVLLDDLESMDLETMKAFGKWATDHDLQIIATRVSTGGECTIIIEDGEVVSE